MVTVCVILFASSGYVCTKSHGEMREQTKTFFLFCSQPRRRPMVNMPGRIPMHERTAGDKGRNRSCPPNPAVPNREPPHRTRPPGTSTTLRSPALGASTWGLQFLQPKSMGPGLVTNEVVDHSRRAGQAPTLYQLARSGRAS